MFEVFAVFFYDVEVQNVGLAEYLLTNVDKFAALVLNSSDYVAFNLTSSLNYSFTAANCQQIVGLAFLAVLARYVEKSAAMRGCHRNPLSRTAHAVLFSSLCLHSHHGQVLACRLLADLSIDSLAAD